MAGITFDDVTKTYGDGYRAVSDLNLEVKDGEFVVLVGPSGCGKTTALRMIAGLEEISGGQIRIGDRVVNNLPPGARDIAMVFQNYALYPHMTVAENIGFALRMRKVPKAEARRRIEETARIIGLVDHLDRKPRQLSGGQRQRVAMGRAIVREPQVFLMDEPLSNLDAKLRVQMRAEISRIQRQLAVTTVYVTHDQIEAMTMGDRVAVMRRGLLQQFDAPQRLYERPANLFVASFIGSPAMNVLEGSLEREGDALVCRVGTAALALPPEVLSARPALASHVGKPIAVGIRPEALDEPGRRDGGDGGRLRGRVQAVEALGPEQLVHVEVDAKPVLVEDVLEGLVDLEEAEDLAEIGTDTDGSPRDRRRPARCVGARPARRADRACGRPPPPPLLRSRQRRGDRCLSRRLQSDRVRLTLLDGSTFVVCDQRGDVDGVSAASGFFAADTRFLSRSVLTIDGERGDPVGFEQSAPHVGVFDLEWETGLAVRRELFVGRGLEEAATVWNRSDREVEVVLELELASDFADIFAVKRVEDLGAPGTSEVAPSRPERWKDARTVEFADQGFPARTLVHLAPAPDEADGGAARYRLRLAPGERWQLGVAVQWLLNGTPELDAAAFEAGLRDDRRERDASLAAWWRSAPRLQAPADTALERTWAQSLADLAALRLRWAGSEHGAGGRAAVVHDAVRPRHVDHVLPGAAARSGGGRRRVARARRGAGGDG